MYASSCCEDESDRVEGRWDLLPQQPANIARGTFAGGKLRGNWDCVPSVPKKQDRWAIEAPRFDDDDSRKRLIQAGVGAGLLLALVIFLIFICTPAAPAPLTKVQKESQEVKKQIEITLPVFNDLVSEKYRNHELAWEALAAGERTVDFLAFQSFAKNLVEHLNSTQAWWVFSELDANQDQELHDMEFYANLAPSNHLM
mmetsp:Transcript_95526/g.199763  ORF Transcript_95526/g.199763 Transcript_95526/m.199763 type:complete len:199 (+) Transcript_95526:252-848(+)